MAKTEKGKTLEEVRTNLETQLKDADNKIEKATQRVDRMVIKRNYVAELLEKVNKVDVES